jgi:hypothetical protein
LLPSNVWSNDSNLSPSSCSFAIPFFCISATALGSPKTSWNDLSRSCRVHCSTERDQYIWHTATGLNETPCNCNKAQTQLRLPCTCTLVSSPHLAPLQVQGFSLRDASDCRREGSSSFCKWTPASPRPKEIIQLQS